MGPDSKPFQADAEGEGYFRRGNFPRQGHLSVRLESRSGETQRADPSGARGGDSTGIWDEGTRQAEPQEANQFYGGANSMRAAMQIAKSVESLNRQGQEGKEPADEQTVGVMAADML